MKPEFLDVDDIVEPHKLQLSEFGGLDGVTYHGSGKIRDSPYPFCADTGKIVPRNPAKEE